VLLIAVTASCRGGALAVTCGEQTHLAGSKCVVDGEDASIDARTTGQNAQGTWSLSCGNVPSECALEVNAWGLYLQ
jgi:hypothetical protein